MTQAVCFNCKRALPIGKPMEELIEDKLPVFCDDPLCSKSFPYAGDAKWDERIKELKEICRHPQQNHMIQDKGMIARLGNRELTQEQLRRLPRSLQDKVKFFPAGGTQFYKGSLDDDLYLTINSGMVNANLEGQSLTADNYINLPDDLKNKVTFSTTQKGRDYPHLPFKDRISAMRGGIGWESREQFIQDFNISHSQLDKLIAAGLVNIVRGEYVIDNRDGNALERIDSFIKKSSSTMWNTGWATKEELINRTSVPPEETEKCLQQFIKEGFVEEKEGMYRINDSDGRGLQRINEFMGRKERASKGTANYIDAIETMVKGGIFDAIKKGWIEFQDGAQYTAEEWEALGSAEQERIGVRLTEKGKREIEDNNPLKIYDELAGKKRADGGLNLIEDVECDDQGNIKLKLTPEGERVKKIGKAMGISPDKIFNTMLHIGLDKQLAKYMFVDGKVIEGNRRVNSKVFI